MNSNVNVMIYPYKKDYSELVYYYTEVLNQTIVLISGCFYEEMGPNINMFQNFSQGLENSETVIFTYSNLIKILRSIKILEENGYDFYRFEKNVEE